MGINALYEISKIDMEIKKLRKDLKDFDGIDEISKLKMDYDSLRKKYLEIKQNEIQIDKELKILDETIKKMTDEFNTYEKDLYQTSSIKAIEGYQKSMGRLKKDIEESEKKAYEMLNTLEGTRNEKKIILENSKLIKDDYNKIKEEYEYKVKEYEDKKSTLLLKREELIEFVDKGVYEEYTLIRKSKNYGMCNIIGEICSGCGMDVPCTIINEVKKKESAVKCPNCGRFIYIEE